MRCEHVEGLMRCDDTAFDVVKEPGVTAGGMETTKWHYYCIAHYPAKQASLFDEPARVYTQDGEPSSGYSGTDTSKAGESNRAKNQAKVFNYLTSRQAGGVTVKEARDFTGLHHGIVSGALSNMHKKGNIARLLSSRDKCRVYVHPDYVRGRETD